MKTFPIKMFGLLVVSLLAILSSSHKVDASVLQMLSTKDLIGTSDSIVLGKVVSEYSDWDSSGRFIVTYTRIQVLDDLKGSESGAGEVTIRHLGGRVGNREMVVHGAARFMVGEKTLLFLKNRTMGFKDILGLGQGKFKIIKDILTGKELAINPADPELRFVDGNFKALDRQKAPGGKPFPLEDFINEIRKELKEGSNINQ